MVLHGGTGFEEEVQMKVKPVFSETPGLWDSLNLILDNSSEDFYI